MSVVGRKYARKRTRRLSFAADPERVRVRLCAMVRATHDRALLVGAAGVDARAEDTEDVRAAKRRRQEAESPGPPPGTPGRTPPPTGGFSRTPSPEPHVSFHPSTSDEVVATRGTRRAGTPHPDAAKRAVSSCAASVSEMDLT